MVARVELPGLAAADTRRRPAARRRCTAPRDLGLAPDLTALAEPITFPTAGGAEAHAYHYPPTNPDFAAPAGELPPLLVLSHGGPTSAANPAYSLGVQFWTSRGFAVVDVDYGGSTGYGRAYRRRLRRPLGHRRRRGLRRRRPWLVDRGLADPDRLAIRGGSAGGFTTLAALTFTDTFRAGASHYGVADLAALATDTHKFESRYLDGLVGPWPDARDRYAERSPIHHTDAPVLPDHPAAGPRGPDRAAPPGRDDGRGAGRQGHPPRLPGLRRRAARLPPGVEHRAGADAELYFYGRVFGFEPADEVEPVPIAFEDRLVVARR